MIKRLFSFALLAMTVVGFVSCSKDDTVANSEVKIKFDVADMPAVGGDTRSVKTGWVEGDEILVLLKATGQINSSIMRDQTITLRKTAEGWSATKNFGSSWGSEGVFYAIYHRGSVVVDAEGKLPNYKGGEIFVYGQRNYTASSSEIDLGTIAMDISSQWTNGVCQISIAGLDSSKNWKLSVVSPGSTPTLYNARNVCYVSSESFYFDGSLTYDTYKDVGSTGVYTGTDHVFWYTMNDDTNSTFEFYLTDGTNAYTYQVTDKGNLEDGKAYTLPAFDSGKWTAK